jgi:hypothetical protein
VSEKLMREIGSRIIAFVPVYTAEGEATQLWLRGGEHLTLPISVRSALRRFWKHYSFDWASYRHQYGVALNRRNLLPWPGDVWRTFAPAKLRQPRVPSDPAYGYVAVEQVVEVLPANSLDRAGCYLLLQDGRRLPVYLEPREMHRHLQTAAYAFQLFWGKRLELRPTMVAEDHNGYWPREPHPEP